MGENFELTTTEVLDLLEPSPHVQSESWKGLLTDYFKDLSDNYLKYRPDPNCFESQIDLTSTMRAMLLNWLLEVCAAFKLSRETYYLSLSTLDRVLSSTSIKQSEFQLIGVTCLYLSVKREEIDNYPIEEFSKLTDKTFTVSQIRQKESEILPLLKWQLYPSTYFNWLNALMKEWDNFIISVFNETIVSMKDSQEDLNRVLVTFKEKNKHSYLRYIQSMELLDICTIDFQVYNFTPIYLVSAILYSVVFKAFAESKFELFPPVDFLADVQDHHGLTGSLIFKFLAGTVEVVCCEQIAAELRFLARFERFEFCDGGERFDGLGLCVREI